MTLPMKDPKTVEHAVDDALRTFPQQPAPRSLAPAVLAALRAPGNERAARPVFRLGWMDFALSGFAALMLVLVFLVSNWMASGAAPRVLALLAGPLAQTNGLAWGLALGGLVVTGGFMLLAGFVFRRPAGWQRL